LALKKIIPREFLYQKIEKENLVAYHLWSKGMDEYSTAVLKSLRNDKMEVLFCAPFNNGRIVRELNTIPLL
jgi:hypothetical protein